MKNQKLMLSILILDDDITYRTLANTFLQKEHTVFGASRPTEAFQHLKNQNIDLVISDFRLPEMTGLEFIAKMKKSYPEIEIIMISSEASTDTVIEAMRLGAIDFFKKPFDFTDMIISIERTEKYRKIKSQWQAAEMKTQALQKDLLQKDGIDIISCNPAMDEIKHIVQKVAQTSDTSVIITGESGTGKELVARSIHNLSSRRDEYFGAVNSSAIPDHLFESEFFGHKKGAFTGAISDRAGWFEVADKGSLFLDEVGDMAPNLQIKMLRVLEERKFVKVGSQKEKPFDVRIIAATNKPISELKAGKDFRIDLFHRLGSFEIYIPPLRDRTEDIPLLVNYFGERFSEKVNKKFQGIEEEAIKLLQQYHFPGNVRELRNLIERALILSDDAFLRAQNFPQISPVKPIEVKQSLELNLEKLERHAVMKALELSEFNKTKAAKMLGINWNALHRRLEKYGIDVGILKKN